MNSSKNGWLTTPSILSIIDNYHLNSMIALYSGMWPFPHSSKWKLGWWIVRLLRGRLMLELFGLVFRLKIIKRKKQSRGSLFLILIWMIMMKLEHVAKVKRYVLTVGNFWSLLHKYLQLVYLMILDSSNWCMCFQEVVVCISGYVMREQEKCLIRWENQVLII